MLYLIKKNRLIIYLQLSMNLVDLVHWWMSLLISTGCSKNVVLALPSCQCTRLNPNFFVISDSLFKFFPGMFPLGWLGSITTTWSPCLQHRQNQHCQEHPIWQYRQTQADPADPSLADWQTKAIHCGHLTVCSQTTQLERYGNVDKNHNFSSL